MVKPCEAGSARGNAYFSDDAKFTACKKCDWTKGHYQNERGKPTCKEVSEGSFVG